MTPATGRDHLSELSQAVAAYINIMGATADCLGDTYPDVGGPYRQRIHRLRSRLAFETTREAVADSAKTLEAELKDYASVTNRILTQRSVELTRGILALGEIVEKLTERQEYFGNHFLSVASQLENPGPAASLRTLVENSNQEAKLMVAQIREQISDLDRRLAGTTSTDPVTGLINRREMERQMEAHKLHGSAFSLLLFELDGVIGDQLLCMAAAKLGSQFRHPEWIARWGAREFAVLFLGGPERAEKRAAQAVSSVEGTYTLESGATVVIAARSRVVNLELVAS